MTTLRHVTDESPGIRRRRAGAHFVYVSPSGHTIRDAATLDRIKALAIPPAWTDVWISPSEDGHIQATGRDARGRKQYRYHQAWTVLRDQAKYEHLIDFGRALPKIRRRTAQDLKRPPLSRERVLATVVRLLEKTLIRIGNDEYARTNKSYGLTTLRNHHVKVRGRRLEFDFRAKSGILQHVDLEDEQLAKTVKRCQELPGQTLFEYLDADGTQQRVESADVNQYLREIVGREFTAKDFRTWAGTLLAACALCSVSRLTPGRSQTARKRHVVAAIDRVAKALGNTRSVCRKCYIHPAVLELYQETGSTLPVPPAPEEVGASRRLIGNSAAERALLTFLRELAKKNRTTRPTVVVRPPAPGRVADATADTPRAAEAPRPREARGNRLAKQKRELEGHERKTVEGAAPWPNHPVNRSPRSRLSIRSAQALRPGSIRRRDLKRPPTMPRAS
jgi:DNA topoisomerase I